MSKNDEKCIRVPKKEKLCLTASQQKKLKLKNTKPIACGNSACVYEREDNNTLVKVTTDESDVEALQRGQGAGVVRVHRTYSLLDKDRDFYAFGMIVDRLEALPNWMWREWISNVREEFRGNGKAVKKCAGFSLVHAVTDKCVYVTETLIDTVNKLKKRGINAVDDLGSDNVGIDKMGKPILLDIGLRQKSKRTKAETLLGSKKRSKSK